MPVPSVACVRIPHFDDDCEDDVNYYGGNDDDDDDGIDEIKRAVIYSEYSQTCFVYGRDPHTIPPV